MKNIFSPEGALFRIVERLTNLVVLNLLYLLFCIPNGYGSGISAADCSETAKNRSGHRKITQNRGSSHRYCRGFTLYRFSD
jgi:hypothetical protein